MPDSSVRYFVFNVESVADGELISRLRYAGQGLNGTDAISRYRAELRAEFGHDFIPYTYQFPVSVAVGKVTADLELVDVVVLDESKYRPHVIAQHFWRGWEAYHHPTLVSFGSRSFALPLMELAAFRYGLQVPGWFNVGAKSFEQFRNRFNLEAHVDLQELLTNFGSSRFAGGLALASNLLGKPGRSEVQSDKIQELYLDGRLTEIADHCRRDLLDTYFVFLRTRVMFAEISLNREQALIGQAKQWLSGKAEQSGAYRAYLERWGDWPNPWSEVTRQKK